MSRYLNNPEVTIRLRGMVPEGSQTDVVLSDGQTLRRNGNAVEAVTLQVASEAAESGGLISADQNDYETEDTTSYVSISSDADGRAFTGFAAGFSGRQLSVYNAGAYDIIIRHESTGSAAANRIRTPWSLDFVLRPGDLWTFIYDGSAQRWILATGHEDFLRDRLYVADLIDEFVGGIGTASNVGDLNEQRTQSGTGAGVSRPNSSSDAVVGQVELATGTTSGGYCCVHMSSNNSIRMVGGLIYECSLAIPTLADGTNDYDIFLGVLQGVTSSSVGNLVALRYDRDTSSNWILVVDAATVDTGVPVAAGTFIYIRLVLNTARNLVEAYINDRSTPAATSSATVIAESTNLVGGAVGIFKEAGTADRTVLVDWHRLRSVRTTRRVG